MRRRMAKASSQSRARPRRRPHGSRFLTVGQTARILGLSPSTLRLWENVGLVRPVRSNGRYRLYSPALLKILKRIKYLRDVPRLNVPGIKRELGATMVDRTTGGRQKHLGPELRMLRRQRGLALAAAAAKAGISAGFLSAVERAQANASVATLHRLAAAYDTTVMALLQTRQRHGSLVKPHERRAVYRHPGVRMEALSDGAPMLQSTLLHVAPQAGGEGCSAHSGEGFIYMLSGRLEIWLDEHQCFVLNAGDGFWFERTHGHRWFNAGEAEATLLWINTPPAL